MSQVSKGRYYFAGFELNVDLRVLARDGQRVPLGPKACEVLTRLAMNAGNVVTKSDLLKEVWAESHVEEATLAQHVFSLRKALGDRAGLIVTVAGQGYRLQGTVRHVPAGPLWMPHSSEEIVHEMHERTHVVFEEPILQPLASAVPRLRWPWALAAAVVVAAIAAGGWSWWHATVPGDHVTLVLADFANLTGDPAFDRTLGRALAIDLEQSPFVDVMGDHEGLNTLKMMGRPGDTPLTPAVAREICERTNRQVLLSGVISNVGDRYLLTLEATDCNSGRRLASAKSEAASRSDVLAALDTAADRVRAKLGESSQSIQAYDVPSAQATTSSLEALKAYSTAAYLTSHSRGFAPRDQLPFYRKAIELDPQFALAYVGMSHCYYELLEPNIATTYLQKAFDLRDRVTAKEKLIIEAHYYDGGSGGDMLKSQETYRTWAAAYPHEVTPWTNMTNSYNELGLYNDAIATGQKAFAMDPSAVNAALLARAYKNAGRFAEARELIEGQRRAGTGSTHANDSMLAITLYQHDQAAYDREVQRGKENGDALWNYDQAINRSMQGRYAESEEFFAAEIRDDDQGNFTEVKDGVLVDEAEIQRDLGLPDQARTTLARMTQGALDMPDVAYEHAVEGDVAWAERYLAVHGNDPHPPGSYLGHMWFPLLHSELALRRGQLSEALNALDACKPYQLKGPLMRVQMAKVYMAMHQPEKAAEVYRNILDTPGSSFGVNYPMAHLWLARAYAAEGDVSGSREEYEQFLGGWKDGDADLPVLQTARTELKFLQSNPISH